MLQITLPEQEWYDDETEMFYTEPPLDLVLEHSLLAVSGWEAKWRKPFLSLLGDDGLSSEELLDYFGFMIVEPSYLLLQNRRSVLARFSSENISDLLAYLNDTPTATTIQNADYTPSRRMITSELIYCWMIGVGISKDYETWNLHRLLTLINVAAIELNPNKEKMSKADTARYYRELNERNKARLGTKG